MPWKTEIDRIVSRNVGDASKGGENEVARAKRTLHDLLALAPDRPESHFHLGAADEILGDQAEDLPESTGAALRWRHLGALDAAARRGERERVSELIDDEQFEECLGQPEGRVALRSVGRLLLRGGQDERVFAWYVKHLEALEGEDDGSRRDAEFLLEEALRRADRYERGERNEEAALERLDRVAAFANDANLESRAKAKVDRKMGRVHQLGARWDDAAACYTRALENLPEDDPYRSVLVGDLALATLGVRGTLDLLPQEERETRDAAREILIGEADGSEGRSYNAIYTLGMLHYEAGDHEAASACFREADQLMRENRAKARIVHARSRFFLGHCLLLLGAEGETLEEATSYIKRDAGPSNLDAEVKEPIFDALLEAVPDVRLPGSRGRGRGRGRGRDRDRDRDRDGDRDGGRDEGRDGGRGRGSKRPTAAEEVAEAQKLLAEDPHAALEHVDKAFRSRPDFDSWASAYRIRLEALVGLNVRDEALRTYERFRAKLYQRGTFDRLEDLLIDSQGPMADLLDDKAYRRELVDLYEVMPERDAQFVEQCLACAQSCLEDGDAEGIRCAVAMLREAEARDSDAVGSQLKDALKAAKKAKVDLEAPDAAASKTIVAELEEEPHILLVGGDEGRRPHLERFKALGKEVGFEASWIFTGSRPPNQTMQEIEQTAEDSSGILIHHHTDADLRAEIKKMADEMDIPLREASWMGASAVDAEVLQTLHDCMFEEEEA